MLDNKVINKVINTSTLWKDAERRPLDVVLAEMSKDGWACVSCEPGELTQVILKRHEKTATLYARNNVVGMVAYEY